MLPEISVIEGSDDTAMLSGVSRREDALQSRVNGSSLVESSMRKTSRQVNPPFLRVKGAGSNAS